jgi:glycosyltransferase involved in cell wall biosynthesis
MISVVVPAYNESELIQTTLESLFKQDYKGDFEVVVVDNNSTDNTAEIARRLGVRVVFCSQKGVAHARQAGAEAAQGSIIVQADADTMYPEGWLSRIQSQFDRHPNAVAVAGTFILRTRPGGLFLNTSYAAYLDCFQLLRLAGQSLFQAPIWPSAKTP